MCSDVYAAARCTNNLFSSHSWVYSCLFPVLVKHKELGNWDHGNQLYRSGVVNDSLLNRNDCYCLKPVVKKFVNFLYSIAGLFLNLSSSTGVHCCKARAPLTVFTLKPGYYKSVNTCNRSVISFLLLWLILEVCCGCVTTYWKWWRSFFLQHK